MRMIGRTFSTFAAAAALAVVSLSGQGGLVANAGPDQSGMFVGTTVHLNGGGSVGATSYASTSDPAERVGGDAERRDHCHADVRARQGRRLHRPADRGNGTTTATDTVVITTGNRPPVANAGADVSADCRREARAERRGLDRS